MACGALFRDRRRPYHESPRASKFHALTWATTPTTAVDHVPRFRNGSPGDRSPLRTARAAPDTCTALASTDAPGEDARRCQFSIHSNPNPKGRVSKDLKSSSTKARPPNVTMIVKTAVYVDV